MPKADENMAEATVVDWLKAEGDPVAKDEDVVQCVADKGEFMLYAEEGGTLRKIYAIANSVVPIGYVLAAIGAEEEDVPDVEAGNAELLARSREKITATEGVAARTPERVRATPAARRVARELEVDLAAVASSTGAPLVREEHVRAYASRSGGTP
jgi:pyruvate dehydrogenase E2 component (dihydrolipoamide acetyltransferase)